MNNLYELFKKTYATVKYIFGLNKTKPPKPIRYTLILLTFPIILIGLLGTLLGFFIVTLIDIYLRLKHGKKYGGIIKGIDLVMESTKKVFAMNVVLVVKRNGSYEEFEHDILYNMKNLYKASRKLRQEIGSFMGFKYYINTETKFEDIVTIIDDVKLNRNNLPDYLNDNFMNAEAILGKKTWNVFILKNPISWNQDNNQPRHLVVQVFRHSVGDGLALVSLFANNVPGFEALNFTDKIKITSPAAHILKEELDDAYVYDNPFRKNETFQRSYIENYLTIFTEDHVKYIPLIKAIKNKLHVGFGDVLSTCLTTALITYAKKIGEDIEKFRISYTLQPLDKETISMIEGKFNYDKITNTVISIYYNVPSNFSQLTLTEAVKSMCDANRESKGSTETFFLNVLKSIAHLGTAPVADYIMARMLRSVNASISNIVGMNAITISGHAVENMFGFVSDALATGFLLCVGSLGNKIQLSLSGPKSVLPSREDLDDILKDMLMLIERLSVDCEVN